MKKKLIYLIFLVLAISSCQLVDKAEVEDLQIIWKSNGTFMAKDLVFDSMTGSTKEYFISKMNRSKPKFILSKGEILSEGSYEIIIKNLDGGKNVFEINEYGEIFWRETGRYFRNEIIVFTLRDLLFREFQLKNIKFVETLEIENSD